MPHLTPLFEVLCTSSHVAEPSSLQEEICDFISSLILILQLSIQFEAEECLLGDSQVVCAMSCVCLAVLLVDQACTLDELVERSESQEVSKCFERSPQVWVQPQLLPDSMDTQPLLVLSILDLSPTIYNSFQDFHLVELGHLTLNLI